MADTDNVEALGQLLADDPEARSRWTQDPVAEAESLGFTDVAADLQNAMHATLVLADKVDAGEEFADVEQALQDAGCAAWLAPAVGAYLATDPDAEDANDTDGHGWRDLSVEGAVGPPTSLTVGGIGGGFGGGLVFWSSMYGKGSDTGWVKSLLTANKAQIDRASRVAGLRDSVRAAKRPRY